MNNTINAINNALNNNNALELAEALDGQINQQGCVILELRAEGLRLRVEMETKTAVIYGATEGWTFEATGEKIAELL